MENLAHVGTFDAESHWRNENLARLPFIDDKDMKYVVMAMDELLFPMTEQGDILLTRFGMNEAFKEYVHSLGFDFISNKQDIVAADPHENHHKSIFQVLAEGRGQYEVGEMLKNVFTISPYAVLPHTSMMCDKYGLKKEFPDVGVVAKVNSKAYSRQLCKKLGIENKGIIVSSSGGLMVEGTNQLRTGPFLIKDVFGVSGKGNLLIYSMSMFQRIVRYLEKQEKQGKEVLFLVEPYLEKEMDFSCQMHIKSDGKYEIISIQMLDNHEFNFLGSYSADESFIVFLEEHNYFEYMKSIAGELYKEGYTGNVCIDSMLLKNHEIVPVVEINARKSMGLINHCIDKHLHEHSLSGNFTYLSMGLFGEVNFEGFLDILERGNLLFKPGRDEGIILLSCNTLFINGRMKEAKNEETFYKGRMYFTAVGDTKEKKAQLITKTRKMMMANGYKIFN